MNKMKTKTLSFYCLILLLVSGTIGISLKFAVYWNHWVYFPLFPNIFDSAFLIVSSVLLAWFTINGHKKGESK